MSPLNSKQYTAISSLCFLDTGNPENSLELASFDGNADKCQIKLEWTTTTEVNFSHFELEKAGDNGTFRKIGSIKSNSYEAKGTRYLFEDSSLRRSTNYRLKSFDHQGNFKYSKVINVLSSCGKKGVKFEAYFRPVKETINLHIINPIKADYCLLLISDNQGALIHESQIALKKGVSAFEINADQFLPATYYVELEGLKWRSRSKRIVIP